MGIRLPSILLTRQVLRQSVFSSGKATIPLDIPKGYFAVYVGETRKRFVVPLSYLNQLSFQKLLREAEEEYEFNHPMEGLTIPCREDTFLAITSNLN